ncbi:bifunctional UDP-N-acetylglucosamine diphosphorylase/glucosamine-1-phosphate N-acetyltransferase GlmU [uncultured Nocardioides sp.]|uniref:bifunctional UDP-N-acetylglucosamine diphosphorylase/glucosamine-1-phosphate N-acetyltransferase GlmU n=2 Tax=uncultured Nocardioides sp. TaxID=198441 RepID=UPI0026032775|nr:bifunctional UDP-N-acetylglucosamine diphosphorylase/glucosamine-1-phosphate N-acetyltransferase GlmU [uncultured Nocardioides sp.]
MAEPVLNDLTVVVLAAGGGTRMRSKTPKMLHALGGRSLLGHVLAAVAETSPRSVVAVVGHQRELVGPHVSGLMPDCLLAVQEEQKGTGHALRVGVEAAKISSGTVLVALGDTPLLTGRSLRDFVAEHEAAQRAVSLLSGDVADPTGYGRVVRDEDGEVLAIIEHKDASPEQLELTEINSGIMAFEAGFLLDALPGLGNDNAQGEYYLTDLVGLAREAGLMVGAHLLDDVVQTEGVNDRTQLASLGRLLNDRVVERWMREGVTVVDPATTWIDVGVELERDVTILPGTQLLGTTSVGEDSVVGPDSTLRDCRVGRGATLTRVHGQSAEIGDGATVGPYSYLRPGTRLGADGKIGGFVETKNAVIGDGAKVPHLSYIGDAEIGEGTNIGAGTITANYDGVAKHRTVVGRHARTGSNNTFVAPTTIGDGASTGGGTVVRGDVPPGALAVSSGPMRVIDGWAEEKRAGTAQGEAAAAARRTPDDHDVTDPSSQPPARDLG